MSKDEIEKEEMERATKLLNGAIEALSWWETQDYEAQSREDMAIRYISKALKLLNTITEKKEVRE